MFIFFKYHKVYIIFIVSIFLLNCQLQEPSKNHGIVFLENRANKLTINKNNKNDVLNIIGQPHSKSINNEDKWIYMERILTKGEYHKLGQNVLKANNILILEFDKYGILKTKELLKKEDIKKLSFSNKTSTTTNGSVYICKQSHLYSKVYNVVCFSGSTQSSSSSTTTVLLLVVVVQYALLASVFFRPLSPFLV